MYKKDFEIRWSDVDANSHLANSAYVNFMSHTRVGFLNEHGFSMRELIAHGIGPVVFSEQIYYFKESFLGQTITVTLAVSGLSDDGMLFKFEHNFYNEKGKHLATCDILGAWIDLKARSLTVLPESLKALMKQFPKSENFKVLTKADTRSSGKVPKNLS
ncbi:acyl-CoA thioesterase [Psychroserpens luteolus]|uniref:acyl-CoA thioesterase n=1 Tax=Psychroserpens luteolus TaxID=2855840 RepID=UPI001E41BB4E|nr:acyl-CoA thioesterase [Psychroserpens luteolus]MCD2258032.1 acyl-CoA thioesterase [Psychroserpens luteolus]